MEQVNEMVSIITPTFNSEKYLRDTYNSILQQTYRNWEWVIVDDCSTDLTFQMLTEIANVDKRVIIRRLEKNSGSGTARNTAIEMAKGRFIAFLDSDDLWHKDKLAFQINAMIENGAAFSHTSYGYIDENGNKIKDTFHVSNSLVSYIDLLKRTEISCLTAIYDASRIGKYYMTNHRRKQDYALWLSILKSGIKSFPIDLELAYYRQRKGSATNKKHKLILNHIKFLMETQEFSVIKAIYFTGYWAMNGIVRYYLK